MGFVSMDEKLLKQIEEHQRLSYEFIFDREVWTRAEVRRFSLGLKKDFPQFFHGMTPNKVILKFPTEELKNKLMEEIEIATKSWRK